MLFHKKKVTLLNKLLSSQGQLSNFLRKPKVIPKVEEEKKPEGLSDLIKEQMKIEAN